MDKEDYSKINPKHQQLKEHDKWNELMTNYIDKVYSEKKINHDWINYIIYYEVNNPYLLTRCLTAHPTQQY